MENHFSKNIKHIREQKKLSQNKLAEILNVNQTTIARWEDENRVPSIDTAIDISLALNVPLHHLVGKDLTTDNASFIELPSNTIKIPILGRIPAGIPIEAIEDVLGYEEIPEEWIKGNKKWFGLQISGKSMYPTYEDKDIIIVLQQSDCESGQDCVVMVNGDDATFKRVIKQDDNIILKPLNNEFEPILFTANDIVNKPVKILGIAKEVRRKIN